jgi:hypothetical protein
MPFARPTSSSLRRAKVTIAVATGEPAGEKFSKREFLAENEGKQPVSAERSEARGANKIAPHRQPAPAAKTQNAPWNVNTQKTCQPPLSLATENRPRMTSKYDVQIFLENVKS